MEKGKLNYLKWIIGCCICMMTMFVMSSETVYAAKETSDFVIKKGVLIEYKGNDEKVEIPSTVTEIGANAFAGNTTMKTLVIPSSVIKVDDSAFDETNVRNLEINSDGFLEALCSSRTCLDNRFSGHVEKLTINVSFVPRMKGPFNYVKKIHFGSKVKEIQGYAFSLWDSITTITGGKNITKIGDNAFYGCSSLTSVSLSDKLQEIGASAFEETKYIENIRTKSGLAIVNGILLDGSKAKGTVKIPSTVTTISGYAFEKNTKIEKLVIPSSVKKVEDFAFFGTNITELEVSSTEFLEALEKRSGCRGLVCCGEYSFWK